MVVVRHQAIGDERERKLGEILLYQVQRIAVVIIGSKDGRPIRSTVVDVIVGALNKLGLAAWHRDNPSFHALNVSHGLLRHVPGTATTIAGQQMNVWAVPGTLASESSDVRFSPFTMLRSYLDGQRRGAGGLLLRVPGTAHEIAGRQMNVWAVPGSWPASQAICAFTFHDAPQLPGRSRRGAGGVASSRPRHGPRDRWSTHDRLGRAGTLAGESSDLRFSPFTMLRSYLDGRDPEQVACCVTSRHGPRDGWSTHELWAVPGTLAGESSDLRFSPFTMLRSYLDGQDAEQVGSFSRPRHGPRDGWWTHDRLGRAGTLASESSDLRFSPFTMLRSYLDSQDAEQVACFSRPRHTPPDGWSTHDRLGRAGDAGQRGSDLHFTPFTMLRSYLDGQDAEQVACFSAYPARPTRSLVGT